MHGFGRTCTREELEVENLAVLEEGCQNLAKQIENMKLFGIPVVVTVNRFAADTDAEVALVQKKALEFGAEACNPITVHSDGGDGAIEAANAVVEACERPSDFQFLYPDSASIKEKIETIATKVYGADGVDYMPEAEEKIKRFTEAGYDNLPIRPSIGAGFLYPILGAMSTMPGLSERPAAVDVDIDVETGRILGLF